MTDVGTAKRGVRKKQRGVVVSKIGDKSIGVVVERRKQHKRYGKIIKHSKKFHVHDEKNEARIGDKVLIVETRPLSHLKRWRLIEIIAKIEEAT